MKIKSFHAKKINILGFLNKQGDLKSYISETSVNIDKVIEVFDDFSLQLAQPTVVVLDNASFHKSKVFKASIAKWATEGSHYFIFLHTHHNSILLRYCGSL